MWNYEKRLQFPVNIKETNPTLASQIIEQFGGTDGELGASMRYLAQRYTMPYKEVQAILTDIGTEELAHIEMICAIVYQLTVNADIEDIENTPFAPYYIAHTKGLYPVSAAGIPWSATGFQSKGDPITDMHEDMAAEQKARTTYDNLLRLTKGTCAYEPLKCLRAREIVHYQRFGEALRIIQDNLDAKNFYAFNPAFDIHNQCKCEKKESDCKCQKDKTASNMPCRKNSRMSDSGMQNSRMQDGCMKDSKMQNGCMQNSRMQDGYMKDSKMQNGCMQNSRMQDGCMKDSKMQNGCMQNSRMQDGCMKDSRMSERNMRNSQMMNRYTHNSQMSSMSKERSQCNTNDNLFFNSDERGSIQDILSNLDDD